MCWWRDEQGLNPVQVAAKKGHVEILEELLEEDLLSVMERVHRGQTVLHLCMKHRQLRALEFLADKLRDLVYAKDDDGETLLHWAVRTQQVESKIYRYLSKKREQTMVVMTLITTMAFQAAVSPPRWGVVGIRSLGIR
ncbi:ankyrin repeat-containing protein NPR4-like [Salvia hispanica]|uniref:ankyrin repeat-containing protein NPR4-like n=1 Tax=Salvia hispanica TaxID=49212 RepID=UPI00200999F9|nr:ankyrin repeat-containing protein NPR4-like [Salvia hispanica]